MILNERAKVPVPMNFGAGILFYNNNYEQEMESVKKIEMIIRPEKLEDVKEILNNLDIHGMTTTMVSGCGNQKGRKKVYRGTEFSINLLPKIKVEMVVPDDLVDKAVQAILRSAKTGKIGDGKIFLSRMDEAIRIRNEQRGEAAL
jgi:nitrogen regulatory protein P-II 1